MKNHTLNLNFPSKRWVRQEWFYLGVLLFIGTLLLFTGLSVRSLWGSEGRWAEIAREMLLSNNYFLPTINGIIYFDKPLLSYWAIIPFSVNGVVTETTARMPGVIAGLFTVIITFLIGRRLFGGKTGFFSSLLLMTSVMFAFWSRTASAEVLNLLAIWLSFWIFISGAIRGSLMHIMLLYVVCAVASFCKGPVAPAVVIASITFYSVFETIIAAKKNNFSLSAIKDAFFPRFLWIISWQGLAGVLAGASIFAILLLMPVIFTGSWSSVQLMWRENVQRFFHPFDHIEPFYIYFKHIPVFFAPWSILMLSSLWAIKRWDKNMSEKLLILLTLAIFLFFTFSGSRRSYYILPILPGLALITGKGITDWLSNYEQSGQKIVGYSAILTSSILILVGAGIMYAFFDRRIPSHFSQIPVGILSLAAGIISLVLFIKNISRKGFSVLIATVFILELWVFNVGMSIAEKNRTLRPFAAKVSEYVKNVGDDKISLFQGYDSALIFYLKRGPLKTLGSVEEIKSFKKRHADGFLIADLPLILKFQQEGTLDGMSAVVVEKDQPGRHKDNLTLFTFNN